MTDGFSLRPYQVAAVDNLRASYRASKSAPLLALPCGAGKTVIFTHVARTMYRKGKRALILVHRSELMRQCSVALKKWNVPHGMIRAGQGMTSHAVQIASVQTLVRRLSRLPAPDLIVIDEAHHAGAATWQKIFEAYPDAKLLGVTATPQRLDGRGLGTHCGGYFDELIDGPSVQTLIDGGYLAKPRVFASANGLDMSGVRARAGDFEHAETQRRVMNREIVGDAVAHYKRICDGVPAIAFCYSIAHADMVTAQFNAAGITSARIDGTMNDNERKLIIDQLAAGIIKVMTSVDLVSEGFDVPVCGAAILLRPTMSMGLYVQQVGRPMRPAPGKQHAFILDHAGNVARHGLPQDERTWSLDGRNADAGPSVKQCPSCYAMLPKTVSVCPECEHCFGTSDNGTRDRVVEQVDGELVELTPEMIAALKEQRRREVNAARTRDDLMAIARQRGYNERWVDHTLRARSRIGRA
jgi:superfamily II DNA or RNA helicase